MYRKQRQTVDEDDDGQPLRPRETKSYRFILAARIIEAINRTADPCQDFYKFACGGWISRNPIPQSQAFWDQMSLMREQLLENLRVLLEQSNDQNDLRPVKLARALYSTCMDTSKKI